LEAASALDLSVIKAKLSQIDDASDGPIAEGRDGMGVDEQLYNKDLKQARMTWSELNKMERRRLRVGERFQLTTVERLNLAITCLLTGFAWGNYSVIWLTAPFISHIQLSYL